jgi:hypothetical protein
MNMELPRLGDQGETCPECGSVLATDQRYCLNCGWRRADPRVDYERALTQPTTAVAGGPAQAGQAVPPQLSPVVAIGAIAVLGVMLLLGVLIGNENDDEPQQVVQGTAPAATTTATPTTPTPTTPTAAAPTPGANAGAAAGGAGTGNVEAGGSGSTEGVEAADTSKSPQENAKGGPDQVATQGEPEKLDPSGPAGGGSDSTCIGC